jgi:hypothetical protein
MAELLTSDQVAAMLIVDVQTLANWRCQNQGPPYLKLGRLVRYRRCNIESWLKSLIQETNADQEEAGRWQIRFAVDGHTYYEMTDLAATERKRTAAMRLEAKVRELVISGRQTSSGSRWFHSARLLRRS